MMTNHIRLIIQLVLSVGVSCSQANSSVDFFRALNIDNESEVASLLAAGLDPNTRSEKGQTGLYLAMREGSTKVAALLLAHPAIRVDATNQANETALMMAALRGNLEWTLRLIERGAAVNRPGWAPLHYAASGPEVAVVQLLLDRGAQIDALAPNRNTALMMAAGYGPEESVTLLLSRGANPKALNERSMRAADFARSAGRAALSARLEQAAQ